MTNQWTGFVVSGPQTSHLTSCMVVIHSRLSAPRWVITAIRTLQMYECCMKSPLGRFRERGQVTQRNIFLTQPSGVGRFGLRYFGAFVFGPLIGFLQMPSKLIP